MGDWREFYALEARPLGRGGQAEVFKARDRQTGEHVALKRILSDDADALARMRREIEVQTDLRHQNIVPVIRHSAQFAWYAMPLAVRALRDLTPPLTNEVILTVANDVCLGLEAAHARQFVHRDITPANILDIGGDPPVWAISDWGLVRRHGRTTATPTQPGEFGTAGFAAPEVWADAHRADHRADIYGVGRVVAWCATGQLPIPNVSLVPPGRWKRFVERTTAQDPAHRCQQVSEVLALLSGEPAHTSRGAIAGIPDAVAAIIRSEAEKDFPDNYSTRRYQIQRETGSWHGLQALQYEDVPATILAGIVEDAVAQFPRNFSTRLYQINREVTAFRALRDFSDASLPSTVLDNIVASARRDFPRNFSTQLYQIQREISAWKELPD